MSIEQGEARRAKWEDDGVWEHLVLVEPRRVVARRPSTRNIPPRKRTSSAIPPRVKRPKIPVAA